MILYWAADTTSGVKLIVDRQVTAIDFKWFCQQNASHIYMESPGDSTNCMDRVIAPHQVKFFVQHINTKKSLSAHFYGGERFPMVNNINGIVMTN